MKENQSSGIYLFSFFSPSENKDTDRLNCFNYFNIKFQRIKIQKFSFLIYFLNKNTSFKQGNINIWIASSSKHMIPHYRQIWMYIYMHIYITPLLHTHFHFSPFCSLRVFKFGPKAYTRSVLV